MSKKLKYRLTNPVATKLHWCSACGWGIPKGKKYIYYGTFFKETSANNKFHEECWACWKAMGHQWDWLLPCVHHDYTSFREALAAKGFTQPILETNLGA